MTTPDYILRGNGLYLPRGFDLPTAPGATYRQQFFAYATVGATIPHAAAEPSPQIWWLPGGDHETHRIVAYLDQYENLLRDHVEELLIRFPHIDAHFDYQSELTWKRQTEERRIDYYDKLGL